MTKQLPNKSIWFLLICFSLFAPEKGWSQNLDYLYDASFTPPNVIGGNSAADARVIVVHEDGRYVIGSSYQINSQGNVTAINRFLPSGDLDLDFLLDDDDFVSLAYVIPYLDYYLLNTSLSIVDCNFNGSVNNPLLFRIPYMHTPYNPPTPPGPTSNWAQEIEDNKLMVAGRFSPDSTNLLDRRHLIRVFPDGSPDTTFEALKCHEPYNAEIIDLYPTPDGKWMIAGQFMDVEGFETPGIARLNEDFSLDTTFVSPFPSSHYYVRIIPGEHRQKLSGAIDDQGRVYVMHKENLTDPNPEILTTRLLPDGSVDNSFTQPEIFAYHMNGSIIKGYIFTMAFEPDGTIIIGGRFREVDGQPRGNIAKLYEDGSLVEDVFNRLGADTANWQNGSNPTINVPHVARIVRLSNGGLLVGGLFSRYDGIEQWGLVRLLPSPVGMEEESFDHASLTCFPNPANSHIHVQLPDDIKVENLSMQIYNISGQLMVEEVLPHSRQPEIQTHELPGGTYFLRVTSDEFSGMGQFVIIK